MLFTRLLALSSQHNIQLGYCWILVEATLPTVVLIVLENRRTWILQLISRRKYRWWMNLDDNLIPFRLQKTLSSSGLTVTRNYTNSGCTGRLRALVPMEDVVRPACWDYNDSINALASCYNVDGRRRDTCVAVGFMQTSYIVQCGGAFELSNHCGTFLELHEPENEMILSQTRLLRQYPNGFRTTTLPLFFQGDRARTVCMGDYEIWWVQRTRYNFVVQNKKKFRISFPRCDFDYATNKYKNYHRVISNEHFEN